MKFLEHDIADKNILRYISRFLKSELWKTEQYWKATKGPHREDRYRQYWQMYIFTMY